MPSLDLEKSLREEILTRYSLPSDEAIEAARFAIEHTLTQEFNTPVSVAINGSIHLSLLKDSGQVTLSTSDINNKLRRHLLYNIDTELQVRQTLREHIYLRQLIGKTVYGQVRRVGQGGKLFVEMELDDIFSKMLLMGECPADKQISREVPYRIGEVLTFAVTSVLPVADEKSAWVRIRLSRSYIDLPALMLKEKSGIERIKCIKRNPGRECWIVSEKRIPKSIINEVGKELREHINVRFTA